MDEEATRGDKQVKQALVLTLDAGLYQNSGPTTRLNWPFHYVAYLGIPALCGDPSPTHYIFGQPEPRGTR
jgi:hypothetical protein